MQTKQIPPVIETTHDRRIFLSNFIGDKVIVRAIGAIDPQLEGYYQHVFLPEYGVCLMVAREDYKPPLGTNAYRYRITKPYEDDIEGVVSAKSQEHMLEIIMQRNSPCKIVPHSTPNSYSIAFPVYTTLETGQIVECGQETWSLDVEPA